MKLILGQKCHFWHGKTSFLIFWPKIRRRMLQNGILSPEIKRTHPNWSKTNRVCQKITSLSLNRDFLAKLNFWNFHLSFPAENERENSHFSKLKFWKKCKNLTFQKNCLESFWWCNGDFYFKHILNFPQINSQPLMTHRDLPWRYFWTWRFHLHSLFWRTL